MHIQEFAGFLSAYTNIDSSFSTEHSSYAMLLPETRKIQYSTKPL